MISHAPLPSLSLPYLSCHEAARAVLSPKGASVYLQRQRRRSDIPRHLNYLQGKAHLASLALYNSRKRKRSAERCAPPLSIASMELVLLLSNFILPCLHSFRPLQAIIPMNSSSHQSHLRFPTRDPARGVRGRSNAGSRFTFDDWPGDK